MMKFVKENCIVRSEAIEHAKEEFDRLMKLITTQERIHLVESASCGIQEIFNDDDDEFPNEVFGIYPMSVSHCVYGKITGDCNNPKAKDLISRCASLFITQKPLSEPINFDNWYADGNYVPKERTLSNRSSFFITALEYILIFDSYLVQNWILDYEE